MLSFKVALLALVFGFPHQSQASEYYQNKLQPFASDGCTASPNGIPYKERSLWLHCCVEHDLSYWPGGTAEEKYTVDKRFEACVTKESNAVIGRIMYLGVRAGGAANGPTSWNWGYGWVVPRGYAPLNAFELAQIGEQMKSVPSDLKSIPLTSTVYFPEKLSVTGDYCLDQVAQKIETKIGHGFNISGVKLSFQQTRELLWKSVYSLTTEECSKPVTGVFYLRIKEGCTIPRDKFTALGTFHPTQISSLNSCGR